METEYDIVFLEFGVPLETRYGTSGELCHLVHFLNKFGMKSAIVIVRDPFTYRGNHMKIRNLIRKFLSSNSVILNIIRKIILSYSKEDYIDFNIIKVKNLKEIEKLNPHFISSWSWQSAYLIDKAPISNNIKVTNPAL